MNKIKALTIHQPWAWLIASGHKRFETRGWQTRYRGPLVIHAAKRPVKFTEWNDHVSAIVLARSGLAALRNDGGLFAYGAAIAIAELTDVIPVGDLLAEFEHTKEYQFGDYSPGRYAWKFGNVRPLAEPLGYRGQQGLWNWPENEYQRLMAKAESSWRRPENCDRGGDE